MSASHALTMSQPVRFGVLGTYVPTLCGVARFSAGLANELQSLGNDVEIVRIADGSGRESEDTELINGSATSIEACVERLNDNDVAVIQHQYGLYGGSHGDEVLSSSSLSTYRPSRSPTKFWRIPNPTSAGSWNASQPRRIASS